MSHKTYKNTTISTQIYIFCRFTLGIEPLNENNSRGSSFLCTYNTLADFHGIKVFFFSGNRPNKYCYCMCFFLSIKQCTKPNTNCKFSQLSISQTSFLSPSSIFAEALLIASITSGEKKRNFRIATKCT